ncbi:NAD(P)-dependent alcohol dehydrogenase [Paenibacillus koleovorans]|uniref:NAD(P)-dependent alcohol dehydrogenase n=1 Tax=Paenibacillus koleovorans TaxID=121608 RepID=UPI000FD77CFB|nr:NAD(P)-dependent alcohol dehydrogenase [Paenibacillus koleovorans]
MKAVICTKYGAPEVLQLQEVDKPEPKEHEVRIRIRSAVVGPSDCAFRKGDPFIVKVMYGLSKPKYAIQGTEFAGEIDAVGSRVTKYRPGDRVFGLSVSSFGCHAEYNCLPEDGLFVPMPDSMPYEDASALSDGGTTSLTFLRDKARIVRGQKVLINGASGAVGIYAVQLAKYYGAEVTGVCSTANLDLVRVYGADHVIDYTQTNFTCHEAMYDVIFDAVGKSSYSRCKRALKPNGIYMSTVPSLSILLSMGRTSLFKGKRALFAATGLIQNRDNLLFLRQLYEEDRLRPVIDRFYSLEQLQEAHRYVDTGRKKGNVVINME